MSPIACTALLQAQRMITTCLVRGRVKFTGSEDIEELSADGTAQAARMLAAAERDGKEIPAGGAVGHFVLTNMQAGRRFGYSGKSDALSPGAVASETIRRDARALELTPDKGVRVRLTGPVPLEDEEFASIAERADVMGIAMLLAVTGEPAKVKVLAGPKSEPFTVTPVPPVVGPTAGVRLAMEGPE